MKKEIKEKLQKELNPIKDNYILSMTLNDDLLFKTQQQIKEIKKDIQIRDDAYDNYLTSLKIKYSATILGVKRCINEQEKQQLNDLYEKSSATKNEQENIDALKLVNEKLTERAKQISVYYNVEFMRLLTKYAENERDLTDAKKLLYDSELDSKLYDEGKEGLKVRYYIYKESYDPATYNFKLSFNQSYLKAKYEKDLRNYDISEITSLYCGVWVGCQKIIDFNNLKIKASNSHYDAWQENARKDYNIIYYYSNAEYKIMIKNALKIVKKDNELKRKITQLNDDFRTFANDNKIIF